MTLLPALLLLLLSVLPAVHADEDPLAPFPEIPPALRSRLVWLETFQDEQLTKPRWVQSQNVRYAGSEFVWKQEQEGAAYFEGETVLSTRVAHKVYGLTYLFEKPVDNTGKDFVIQYEVRVRGPISCSGAYVKLLAEMKGFRAVDLEESTPYVVMFGPDKCGANSKVHFILREENPISHVVEEKHLASPPKATVLESGDLISHLFTLVIRKDNSFSMKIDGEEKASGNLLTPGTFSPDFGAPLEIDDPDDRKPADWEDEPKIRDPDAKKPEDWDEEAPQMIKDPAAKMPEEWNEEDDGVWEPPSIPNPNYKGKWAPPMVDNPNYKGAWRPRRVPNPAHFVSSRPTDFRVAGLAIEILANEEDIAFDDFLVGHDEQAAKEVADLIFFPKQKHQLDAIRAAAEKHREETLNAAWERGVAGKIEYVVMKCSDWFSRNWKTLLATTLVAIAGSVYWCCIRGPRTPPSSRPAAPSDDSEDEDDDDDDDEREEEENATKKVPSGTTTTTTASSSTPTDAAASLTTKKAQ